MANLEEEVRDLREKNSELAQEVQSLKILNAQKDKEKLELTKEVNDLRLKICRLRSGGAAQARKLDVGLQSASQEALSHLVQASGAVARTMEIVKQYIQERQELDSSSPRWSSIGSSSTEKVNKVPPLMLGGQSIQPVVSLSRTMLNNRSLTRSPNQNNGVTHRAVPIHMLQDVYIPLTRIDAAELQANGLEPEDNIDRDNSIQDLGLEDNEDQPDTENDESQQLSSIGELEESRALDAVLEESAELEEGAATPRAPSRGRTPAPTPAPTPASAGAGAENPLEGPSWLLDVASSSMDDSGVPFGSNLEPDSTTPCDPGRRGGSAGGSGGGGGSDSGDYRSSGAGLCAGAGVCVSLAFTPTVRRRKRTCSPPPAFGASPTPPTPPTPPRKHSTSRVLKVVVSKMRLADDDPGGSGDASPPKRAAPQGSAPQSPRGEGDATPDRRGRERRSRPRFDAPSPNGATDSAVIVCETTPKASTSIGRLSRRDSLREAHGEGRGRAHSRSHSRSMSRVEYSDSDQSSAGEQDTRSRRTRKQVSYKEKPLNRKLRR